MILIINVFNVLAYDFIRINSTMYDDCRTHGEEFETLAEAQSECKRSRQCKGVLDIECNGQSSYLCPQNSTASSNSVIDSCIYEKYAIGGFDSFLVTLYKYRNIIVIDFSVAYFIFHEIDPCDRLLCNVTNTVCQVVFDTGTPFCACAPGYMGDPAVECGNYIHFLGEDN